MSNYVQNTNFTAKDSLASGLEAKKVKGVDLDGEFAPIATAITSKVDKTGATMTGNLDLGDNVRLRFGTDNDLQLWHDASNSYISDTGTGELRIGGADAVRVMNADFTKTGLLVTTSGTNAGTTYLMYDNNSKLATTNTGVNVTGELVATTINGGTF
tara:strand:- start:294 stop:764 length:471 start_codon:yes stop_codon:yes gene_type:complete